MTGQSSTVTFYSSVRYRDNQATIRPARAHARLGALRGPSRPGAQCPTHRHEPRLGGRDAGERRLGRGAAFAGWRGRIPYPLRRRCRQRAERVCRRGRRRDPGEPPDTDYGSRDFTVRDPAGTFGRSALTVRWPARIGRARRADPRGAGVGPRALVEGLSRMPGARQAAVGRVGAATHGHHHRRVPGRPPVGQIEQPPSAPSKALATSPLLYQSNSGPTPSLSPATDPPRETAAPVTVLPVISSFRSRSSITTASTASTYPRHASRDPRSSARVQTRRRNPKRHAPRFACIGTVPRGCRARPRPLRPGAVLMLWIELMSSPSPHRPATNAANPCSGWRLGGISMRTAPSVLVPYFMVCTDQHRLLVEPLA
jgi:hypothetical protein